jgi:hypothetical protein
MEPINAYSNWTEQANRQFKQGLIKKAKTNNINKEPEAAVKNSENFIRVDLKKLKGCNMFAPKGTVKN